MAKKTEDKLSVGHHDGPQWGYDVLPDGRVRVPPILAEAMNEILDREEGLRRLLDETNRFVAAELTRTGREARGWWNRVEEGLDIGIAKGSGWSYDFYSKTITPNPPLADDSLKTPAK